MTTKITDFSPGGTEVNGRCGHALVEAGLRPALGSQPRGKTQAVIQYSPACVFLSPGSRPREAWLDERFDQRPSSPLFSVPPFLRCKTRSLRNLPNFEARASKPELKRSNSKDRSQKIDARMTTSARAQAARTSASTADEGLP
jgi:hypothetical protein